MARPRSGGGNICSGPRIFKCPQIQIPKPVCFPRGGSKRIPVPNIAPLTHSKTVRFWAAKRGRRILTKRRAGQGFAPGQSKVGFGADRSLFSAFGPARRALPGLNGRVRR